MSKQPVAMAPPPSAQSVYDEMRQAVQDLQYQKQYAQNAAQNMLGGQAEQNPLAQGMQQAQAQQARAETPAERIAREIQNMARRQRNQEARKLVLEFFQAQCNINPFASDKEAARIYDAAIRVAIEEVIK